MFEFGFIRLSDTHVFLQYYNTIIMSEVGHHYDMDVQSEGFNVKC